MARKKEDEQTRLLRLLMKEEFQAEWPCRNQVMIEMVDCGLAKIAGKFTAWWGDRERHCARIAITAAGREIFLLQNPNS